MTTPTPDDLVASIARAIATDATADHRRAGRQACILLASTLGEPGEPMAPPGLASRTPRIDGAQLMDLALVKMRAFLAELEAKAPTSAASPASTNPPRSSTASTRPRGLQIPILGGYARKG